MHMVILDNDENKEFKPFAVAIQIDTLEDLANLVKRFNMTADMIDLKYKPEKDRPKGKADRIETIAIWRYLEEKYRVFEHYLEGDQKKKKRSSKK